MGSTHAVRGSPEAGQKSSAKEETRMIMPDQIAGIEKKRRARILFLGSNQATPTCTARDRLATGSAHERVDHDEVVTKHFLAERVMLLPVHVGADAGDERLDVLDGAFHVGIQRQAAQLGERGTL